MGENNNTVFNRQILFFILLMTIAASIPWLGGFSGRGVVCIFVNLVTAFSVFSCFYKVYKDETIALLCAALYVLSFYRIYTIAIAGNITEGIVLAFLPWVIYSWYRLCCAERKCLELVKASCATAVIGVFWYMSAFADFRLQGGMEWHNMYMNSFQDKGLYLANMWFQFWKGEGGAWSTMEDMQNTVPVGIGFVLLLSICLFAFLWYGNHLAEENGRSLLAKISMWCAVVTIGMSLNVFPWEWLREFSGLVFKAIGAIRFPYRFLGWSVLFAVEIFGYCLWYFKARNRWIYEIAVVAGIVSMLTGGIYMMEFIVQ